MRIPPPLVAALKTLRSAGGRPHLTGGCVRDWQWGLEPKDFDIEVFGLDYESMGRALAPFGPTDLVGRSFGVLKLRLDGLEYDFSLPRRESKTGAGHRGFVIAPDPSLTEAEAAARRDFTINSLAYDPLTDRLIDPHGGVADLKKKILRHTSEAFAEDPLRVLRAMQLAARFDLTMVPETVALCRSIRDSFKGQGARTLVLNDEAHHLFSHPDKAMKELSEADRLWDAGKKAEAVTKYKYVLGKNLSGIPGNSERPRVYQRVIDFDVDQGDLVAAQAMIEQAFDKQVSISSDNPGTKQLVAQVRAERERRELAERTRREAEAKRKEEDRIADAKRQQEEREAKKKADHDNADAKVMAGFDAPIQAAITRNFNLVGLPPRLSCTFLIRMVPGGEVVGVQVEKSSGNPVFDQRARDAVYQASPLPVPAEQRLFEKMRDLRLEFAP